MKAYTVETDAGLCQVTAEDEYAARKAARAWAVERTGRKPGDIKVYGATEARPEDALPVGHQCITPGCAGRVLWDQGSDYCAACILADSTSAP